MCGRCVTTPSTVWVMYHERFLDAAQRVLDGDDSIRAANELEGVVLDDYPGDERFENLVEVLALYAPGQGSPYSEAQQVREVIRTTIADLG
jgi:hypothetical protein